MHAELPARPHLEHYRKQAAAPAPCSTSAPTAASSCPTPYTASLGLEDER
jgi:hypothetical protein